MKRKRTSGDALRRHKLIIFVAWVAFAALAGGFVAAAHVTHGMLALYAILLAVGLGVTVHEYRFLGAAWPEMAAFLATHELA